MLVAVHEPSAPLSISEAAVVIRDLINAKPQTPTQDEIESVLERMATHINVVGERIICNSCLAKRKRRDEPHEADASFDHRNVHFEPLLGGDDEPIKFDADMIVNDLMPTVHMAFVAAGKTKAELTEVVRTMLAKDVEDVIDALNAFKGAAGKLDAMKVISEIAWARILFLAEPLEGERLAEYERDNTGH